MAGQFMEQARLACNDYVTTLCEIKQLCANGLNSISMKNIDRDFFGSRI